MSETTELAYIHRFVPATDADRLPVLLLHGTGGDEHDLIDFGHAVAPGAALLSPRGNVLENGMPRFFRRLREGVFDEQDVIRRAHELADFVAAAQLRYGIAAPVALGFSNGANIAAALLQLRPEALAGAALLRAMVPLKEAPTASLAGKPVLLLSGASDPIVPAAEAALLAERFAAVGARVSAHTLPAGHGLTQPDLNLTRSWFDTATRS
ncbi:alpha/beta hydrolase [Xanthobacteraceae bacterium Astr-EGSB]|uniref:alpha/beta hydrolase n=1 Tax=Astrobacterium formosum TaxID=3069710 RepID=UPI0027B2FC8F|nr:alpha/beta hydrolase [Xanthobacteraceae bacterium Astr-EGSB]